MGRKIREALRLSDRILLLITPNSKDSPWVVAEAGAAWGLGKKLIPVLAYVKTAELINFVASHQARLIHTPEQIEDQCVNFLLINRLDMVISPDNGKTSPTETLLSLGNRKIEFSAITISGKGTRSEAFIGATSITASLNMIGGGWMELTRDMDR